MTNPHERLRHHVTGAIERGEKTAITRVLGVNQLEPGKRYRVVSIGTADPEFKDAIVLGCGRHLGYRGVTIETPNAHDKEWLGTLWGDTDPDSTSDDSEATFEELP
jgi:hypothetical protein